jgi:hypothetical protein
MKTAVVVATTPGRSQWVNDCLASITLPSLVVSGFGYELGKLKWVYDNTDIDKFVFLQDSVIIRDNELLLSLFDIEGSSCLFEDYNCLNGYLGVYERSTLNTLEIPEVRNKREAVHYEHHWTWEYIQHCEVFSHPISKNVTQIETLFKHGRANQVTVTPLLEKWKGTWTPSMINDND